MSKNLMYAFFSIAPTERIPHRARRPSDRERLFQYHDQMAAALRDKKEIFTKMVNEGAVTGADVAQPMGSRVWQTRIFSLAGCYTKEEIAAALDIKPEAISSYMANLSMMGEWFIYDDEGHLKLCSAEEREAWEAEQRKNRKSTSRRSPQEQANAVAATLERKEKQLEGQQQRVTDTVSRLQVDPEDEDLLDQQARAEAMVIVLTIDIKWLKQKMESLPEPEVVEEADDSEEEAEDTCEDEIAAEEEAQAEEELDAAQSEGGEEDLL